MNHSLTIIGGGPGGYTAAFAAARAGMSVTLVESGPMGGTCLNNGCIPTKTIKTSADALQTARRLAELGINGPEGFSPDLEAIIARKNRVCATLMQGLERGCGHHKVTLARGKGRIIGPGAVEVSPARGEAFEVKRDSIIIATGSNVLELPGLQYDHKYILSSDDALNLNHVPERLVIVGGGVIGCEMAFNFKVFGSQVTVVEGGGRLIPIPSVDEDLSKLLQREMKKARITLHTGKTLQDARVDQGVVRGVITKSPFTSSDRPVEDVAIEADAVLVTVGRTPNTQGLGLEEMGIATDSRGWITVDDHLRTSVPGIFAIGDVLGPSKCMLAHVAAREGLCAVQTCLGKETAMDYAAVPSGIFTSPEIGSVGISEQQAALRGLDVESRTFQVRELGKAHAMGEIAGFCKIIAHKNTNAVLGVHMAGAHATDIINEAALAINSGATAKDISSTIHAHPTLAEGLYEAAAMFDH